MIDAGFRYVPGNSPLVVSMPHVGTALPAELVAHYNATGQSVCDTDWHVDRLYDFLKALNATLLVAYWSRWVIDLNRDPEGQPLYPGSFETGLCPTQNFSGDPIYQGGCAPDAAEVARRLNLYWRPYHEELQRALATAKARHGYAILLDAHSVRSRCPQLFEGRLPDINIGTNSGRSCAPALVEALTATLRTQDRFSWVVDGRFKGGWITRHYGRPAENVHAVQIELAQAAYMDEMAPERFDAQQAAPLRTLLQQALTAAMSVAL